MAYIHKAEIIFVDVNEEFETVNDIVNEIDNSDYLPNTKLISGETKEFEWDDDVIVNRIDATPKQCLEFFDNPPPKIEIKLNNYIVFIDPIAARSHVTAIQDPADFELSTFEISKIKESETGSYTIYVQAESEIGAISLAKALLGQYIDRKKQRIMSVADHYTVN